MSIFRSTFAPKIKAQLEKRQEFFKKRDQQTLQYLSARNAWIRMQSSVDVDGKSDLAKSYVLQGGTLDKGGGIKKGVGNATTNVYSSKTPAGTLHRLGIRPMPGITSIDVKSKSAYGSLREVTVNFQCWDIKQLEELEVLYMRPGYTVLVEWGWAPYFDNQGKTQINNFGEYNILDPISKDRTTIFSELYKKSSNDYNGNYDAMYGYVKNYSWTARLDGGYDCQTIIISTGEIIESLKVNYLKPEAIIGIDDGLLNAEFSNQGNSLDRWKGKYQKNILAGIWAEAYEKIKDPNAPFSPTSIFKDETALVILKALKTTDYDSSLSANSSLQVYITLDAFVNIMNKHIILKSKQDNKPLIELSVKSNGYDNNNDYLNCIAHPLQISVDPSVCLIRNPLWMGKDGFIDVVQDQAVATTAPDRKVANDAANLIFEGYKGFGTKEIKLVEGVSKITTLLQLTYFNEYISLYGDYDDLQEVLNKELEEDNLDVLLKIKAQLETINGVIVDYKPKILQLAGGPESRLKSEGRYGEVTEKEFNDFLLTKGKFYLVKDDIYVITEDFRKNTIRITVPATQTAPGTPYTILKEASSAIANIEFLNKLTYDYFYNNKPENEIATQAHIYVNVDYLFRKSIDANIELQDKNGKNEINLYAYVKKVMYDIQTSIGNINNFEVHVDPQDNVARIIDINYTEPDKAAYNNLFPLEIHNLSSTVRSYSLESKIFPEQSAMIAIGAQVKGGQIGIQSNTMIDFNRNLTDRIIKEKIFPGNSDLAVTNNVPSITNGIAEIIKAFDALNQRPVASGTTTDINSLFANAKNSLRDIIIYFQSLVPSPGSNRGIIPTKFSFEMDGIGGLVIGNMFRLPKDILPKGYRGELNGIGSQLAQAITGIGHTISNGEWKTKVDTLNIVLDNNKSKFNKLNLSELKKQVAAAVNYNLSAAAQGPSRDLNTINQIILHDTDGFGGIPQTIATLNDNRESIHYIIDRNGKIARPVGIEKAAQHAEVANRLSVGIEICNSNGMIQLSNGTLKGTGNHIYPNSGKEGEKVLLGLVTQEGQNVTGGIRDLGWFLNQRRFYEGYSVAQMDALKTVILEILQKCPNIKLNYTADELNIYQNVFGLKSLTALPTKNQQINTTRDWNASNSGIFAHAVISNQRGDAHVDPEMTRILKAIKTETNR